MKVDDSNKGGDFWTVGEAEDGEVFKWGDHAMVATDEYTDGDKLRICVRVDDGVVVRLDDSGVPDAWYPDATIVLRPE